MKKFYTAIQNYLEAIGFMTPIKVLTEKQLRNTVTH
jgi:hypothetical protein